MKKPKVKSKSKTHYDEPWKDIIQKYFKDFMEFFFPDPYAGIDWTKKIKFLNKELEQLAPDAKTGRRYADILVEAYHKLGGQKVILYLHIEIQSQQDDDFAHRMFTYNHRISDRHKSPVESFAILGDNNPNWRPNCYKSEAFWTPHHFAFSIAKILDWKDEWPYLEAHSNIFATVVMVHLRTLETKKDSPTRACHQLIVS